MMYVTDLLYYRFSVYTQNESQISSATFFQRTKLIIRQKREIIKISKLILSVIKYLPRLL